jgi:hypothetical protein
MLSAADTIPVTANSHRVLEKAVQRLLVSFRAEVRGGLEIGCFMVSAILWRC